MELKKDIVRDLYAVKLTAEEGGKIIAWGFLYIIKNDRHPEPYGLIENIYVEQEYRGQGIGSRLLRDLVQEGKERGCYKLVMQSRHSKPEVHALYERTGFKNHGLNFRMDLIDSKAQQRD